MNFHSIPPLISSIITLFSGLFVFTKNKKSLVNILLSMAYFCVFVWLFGYFIVYNTKNERIALFWCKIVYTGVIFIPPFFYHFIEALLGLRRTKIAILVNYVLSFIFIGFLFFTPYLVAGTYKYFWGYQTKAGFLHNFFLIFFTVVLCASFIKIYNKCKISKKNSLLLEYNRLRYVLITFVTCFFASLDFIPNYGIEWYPFGFIFVNIMGILLTYTIVRFRLLDINIVLTRAGIFAIVYTLVLGIPFGIGGTLKVHLSKVMPDWWLIPLVLMAVFASLAPFIYMRLQKKVEARLRAEEFKAHEALRRLSHNMLRFSNLGLLLKLIIHHLVKILRLKFAAIYLLDRQSNKYLLNSFWQVEEDANLPVEISQDSFLIKDFTLRRVPITTEEMKLFAQGSISTHTKGLLKILTNLKANTIIPSFLRDELLGFLVLSDRRTNLAFTQEDLNLLMVLSNEAALAIENAQFHQKEKMLLMEKSRREALADMAPGASHQFNNRLATITSTAELLEMQIEDIDIDTVQDEKLKNILKETKDALALIEKEAYKGKEITQAILKRAKAKADLQEVNIVKLIEDTYRLVLISRAKTELEGFSEPKFKTTILNDIPLIFASEALMQDTFYNLMDNGIDALQKKHTLISQGALQELGFQEEIEVILEIKVENLLIQLKDNGVGMTKDEQRKLFAPYFTTKGTSGKGTGLGLYVIRDFIEMHKGSIMCDSEYGKGTTFTIRLPIKKK